MYRLLSRSAVGTAPNLPLKRASVDAGLINSDEWDALLSIMDARSLTLVPLASVEAALPPEFLFDFPRDWFIGKLCTWRPQPVRCELCSSL